MKINGGLDMFNRRKDRIKKVAPHVDRKGESLNESRAGEEAKLTMPDQLGADGFIRTPSAEHLSIDANEPTNVINENIGNEVEKDSN
jgi:hypothetical protein